MTSPTTWAEGAAFHKRYATAALAQTALHRSTVARRAGVPTPVARLGPQDDVLTFEQIIPSEKPSLHAMLAPLAALRRMPSAGLARYDPFARITPRLSSASPQVQRRVADLMAADQATGWPGDTVLHGDFHPGQVIRDAQDKVWLVDLDDLALGPAEADLGNLAAWMVTQQPTHVAAGSAMAMARVRAAWIAMGETADAALVAHFCAIALIRRALKLRERGRDWVTRQLLPDQVGR